MSSRDLFVSYGRSRREVDELFGDARRRRAGSMWEPAVDVFYVDDPPRAIVHAELPGVDASRVTLEIHGRELLLAGHRAAPASEGRLYQQIEIEHGSFRRVIPLGADVDKDAAKARYVDGILEVTLPLVRPEPRRRKVSITTPEGDA